jgi:uncharacterized protein YgiM (DUF1202 family)
MKKISQILLLSAAWMLILPEMHAQGMLPRNIIIVGTNVNIRSGQGTNTEVVGQLNSGDECELLEKGRQENLGGKTDYWYRVQLPERRDGWVFGAFTALNQAAVKAADFTGIFHDCWFSDQTGDGGCRMMVEIKATGTEDYEGILTQGIPMTTENAQYPPQQMLNLKISAGGVVSFDVLFYEEWDWENNVPLKFYMRKALGIIYGDQLEFTFDDAPRSPITIARRKM